MKLPILFCLSAYVCAYAQVNNASLGGLITDPSQAVVSGASVTAQNKATGVKRQVLTTSTGYYSFASLPVVSIEHPGFEKVVKLVTLETADKARQDCNLTVGQVGTTVEVQLTSILYSGDLDAVPRARLAGFFASEP